MRGQATLTKDEAEKLVQAACSAMSAELARLRAELEKARAELATLDISYKEAIHSIGVDRHNAERWQSECLNAREEARRLQALIERRRIEANDTRVNAAGWEERALRAERDKYAAALVEIRGICTAMMDGWGQTVEVLDRIRRITLNAIKRQPSEPPHRPETFA